MSISSLIVLATRYSNIRYEIKLRGIGELEWTESSGMKELKQDDFGSINNSMNV